MTSALHKVVGKMMNPILRQCEMKTIIEELASTENLTKIVIHSLFTCYFPPWGRRGFKPRIRPPYPQRVVKGD